MALHKLASARAVVSRSRTLFKQSQVRSASDHGHAPASHPIEPTPPTKMKDYGKMMSGTYFEGEKAKRSPWNILGLVSVGIIISLVSIITHFP